MNFIAYLASFTEGEQAREKPELPSLCPRLGQPRLQFKPSAILIRLGIHHGRVVRLCGQLVIDSGDHQSIWQCYCRTDLRVIPVATAGFEDYAIGMF